MKVPAVKENCQAEQHGPTGIHQPRKTETSLQTRKEDICPFKNQHPFKQDLSKKYQYTLILGMYGVLLSLPELTKSTKTC
jgi:hypothetical protein